MAVSTVGGDLPVRHYYRHEYDAVDGCIISSNRGQGSQVSAHLFSTKDKMFYTSQDCNQNNQPSAEPSPDAIEAHRRKFPKVVINVGGVRHEVMWRLFLKRPLTRLGMLMRMRFTLTEIP